MSTPRVKDLIAQKKAAGEGVVVGYLPIGFPTLDTSVQAAIALLEEGVDILELGVPYSDPVMDGPVIAKATQTALENGFRLNQLFDAIKTISSHSHQPLLVMTYWNPVLQYGVERFTRDLLASGATGLITPDLIPDEAGEWMEVSERLGAERVFLAAPSSSDERLRQAIDASRGFVYAVSTMGITGARDDVDKAAKTLVERLHNLGAEQVCVGLGISTGNQVDDVVSYAEGAIVGSALVKALEEGGVDRLREVARGLVHRGSLTAQ